MSTELNTTYRKSEDRSGYVVIPSSRATSEIGNPKEDTGGLQANGFNPHVGQKEILIDCEAGTQKIVDLMETQNNQQKTTNKKPQKNIVAENAKISTTVDRRQFVDPSVVQPTPPPAKKIDNEPKARVLLHFPGVRVPYKFNEVIIKPESGTLVLVTDLRAKSQDIPEFEPTTDNNYITLSIPDENLLFFCSYFGQKFVIMDTYEVTIMVIENLTALERAES